MMGIMSPARCCCACEDCCNGNDPTEFDVTVTLGDDECDTCDSFVSGTYTLAKSGSCRWRYTSGAISGQYCVTPYPANNDKITEVSASLSINCISETEYRIVLLLSVVRTYDTGEEAAYGSPFQTRNYFGLDVYRFESTVLFTEFQCDTAADYELTLVSKTATRIFEFFNLVFWQPINLTVPADSTNWMGWDIDYHCAPTAASITAIP